MNNEMQLLEYKIILERAVMEIVEKKSRFIATLCPVQTEEEAHSFIEETRKKYWDARHHCSAFVIGKNGELTRCSDDGEPSGTAGKPILEVLLGEDIKNVAVVVTRYFGGTLLGTGGLVRAYTRATKEVLLISHVDVMRYGAMMEITTDYNGIGKIQYILGKREIAIIKSEYGENVVIRVIFPIPIFELCIKEIVEATAGKTDIIEIERLYYIDKNPLLH